MDRHWGHIRNGTITGWQAITYIAAVMTYHGATKSERKKLREKLAGVDG